MVDTVVLVHGPIQELDEGKDRIALGYRVQAFDVFLKRFDLS